MCRIPNICWSHDRILKQQFEEPKTSSREKATWWSNLQSSLHRSFSAFSNILCSLAQWFQMASYITLKFFFILIFQHRNHRKKKEIVQRRRSVVQRVRSALHSQKRRLFWVHSNTLICTGVLCMQPAKVAVQFVWIRLHGDVRCPR